jgi:general secretion pathway protein C
MRRALEPRARRLLLRVPRANLYSLLELGLLLLLALQSARLFWTILTPVGPIGEWRLPASLRAVPAAGTALDFDPFFRIAPPSGAVVVTSLTLQLFGVRQDEATGRGSAIISTPDGKQSSFAVGDEIVPGVKLKSVDFDSVTIDRGGATEQLFMDQSQSVPGAVPGPPSPAPSFAPPAGSPPAMVSPPTPRSVPAGNPATDIRFEPRINGTRLTGIAVAPQGSGNAFRAAGLAPGDVIISANGRRITSPDQVRELGSQIGAEPLILQVERDGRVLTLRPGAGR